VKPQIKWVRHSTDPEFCQCGDGRPAIARHEYRVGTMHGCPSNGLMLRNINRRSFIRMKLSEDSGGRVIGAKGNFDDRNNR
jgi:hypothetical protein